MGRADVMKLVITIDTEEDNQWKQSNATPTTENIKCIPRFQELCDRYGLKPTYLCTYGVVKSEEFDNILRGYHGEGIAEIGAHLHPWATPPFEGHYQNDLYERPHPSELPLEVFRKKLEALTDLMVSKGGLKPRSYRAGRWGFCASHIQVLLDLGYQVDCSVTPFVSWQHHMGKDEGGPDFRSAPVEPYFLDSEDVCARGVSGLMEVPVTILYTTPVMRSSKYLQRQFSKYRRTLACRILGRVFNLDPKWFRPYPDMTTKALENVYYGALKQGLPVVEMMFHSSELMAGGSPYNPTPDSIENLYAKLESVFDTLSTNNVQSVTLQEFVDEYSQSQALR